jgi:quercetin dioxygenase-like cupin family protein
MDASRLRDTNLVRDGRADKPAKTTLFETPRFFADVWVLQPGQSQTPHRHGGEDKLYHVLSGRGEATSGTHVHEVGPGEIVFCPAGEDHAIRALGPDDLRLLVFMSPHPRLRAAGVQ